MMSEKSSSPVGQNRPYPWRCVECNAKEVYPKATQYTASLRHDGRAYEIQIPNLIIPTCQKCGDQLMTAEADDRVIAALREKIGLLTPQGILQGRADLGLTQQEMADQLGIAKETISRWENSGLIQSRAMDNLLRLFFGSREVRRLLSRGFETTHASPASQA